MDSEQPDTPPDQQPQTPEPGSSADVPPSATQNGETQTNSSTSSPQSNDSLTKENTESIAESSPVAGETPPAPPFQGGENGAVPHNFTGQIDPCEFSLGERYERWVIANLAPLALIVISLALIVGLRFVPEDKSELRSEPEKTAQSVPETEKPRLTGVNLGVICTFGLVAAYFFIPDVRRWFKRYTPRPLPALRSLDLLAAFVLSQAFGAFLFVLAHAIHIRKVLGNGLSPRLAAGLVLEDLALCSALIAAIWLARRRAAGPHGSMGLWPFWKLFQGERSMWQDVVLGALCYPVFFIVGYLFFVPLGRELVEYFGYHPQPHQLLTALHEPLKPWVLAVFLVSATAGAAFFEELIFRGMLYNVLRRYLGHWGGAGLAALIFALLHPMGDWLGIFFLGLLLTWLYDKTGRLVASMTLHALNNSVAMAVTLLVEYSQHAGPPK